MNDENESICSRFSKHTDVMKTQGLKQALDKHGFDVAFGGARRDEENLEPRKGYFHSETKTTIGTQKGRGQNFGMSTTLAKTRENHQGVPFQTGQNWISGSTFI